MKMDAYNQALLRFGPELNDIDQKLKGQDSILTNTQQLNEGKEKRL